MVGLGVSFEIIGVDVIVSGVVLDVDALTDVVDDGWMSVVGEELVATPDVVDDGDGEDEYVADAVLYDDE